MSELELGAGDCMVRWATNSRLLGQALLVAGSCLMVVMLALQVGGSNEFLALALVAAVGVAVLAATFPSWLIATGGVLIFVAGYSVAGVPLPEVGAVLIIVGTLMSPGTQWRLPSVLLFTTLLLFIWILFLSWGDLGDPVVNKRFLSLTLWLALVVVLSMPSANRPVVARGLLVGLMASLPASLVLGSGYGDRGAGLVGDPNAFAMVVAIAAPLVVGQLSLRRWQNFGVWFVSAAAVIIADSRTGMLALAVGALVYSLLPRMRLWALGIPFLAVFAASNAPDDLIRGGRWEERAGSDELRARIDEASSRQIAESPLTGHGLGSASVDLNVYGNPREDLTFFLHNSYKSIITEIGVIGFGLYSAIALGAILHALRGDMNRGALAALAAGGVMATQLGEVLFAIPMALAIGMAWGSSATVEPNMGSRYVAPTRPVGQSDPNITVAA